MAFAKGGMGYGEAKKLLLEVLEKSFEIPSGIYLEYMDKPGQIDEMLAAGAQKARKAAKETLSRAREAAGFKPLI